MQLLQDASADLANSGKDKATKAMTLAPANFLETLLLIFFHRFFRLVGCWLYFGSIVAPCLLLGNFCNKRKVLRLADNGHEWKVSFLLRYMHVSRSLESAARDQGANPRVLEDSPEQFLPG